MGTAFQVIYWGIYLFAAGTGISAIGMGWHEQLLKAAAWLFLAAGLVVAIVLIGLNWSSSIAPSDTKNDMPGYGAVLLAAYTLMYLGGCLLVAILARLLRSLQTRESR